MRTFNLITKMRLNFFAMTSAALVACGVTAVNLYTMQDVESQELAQSYQDAYSHDLSQTYVQTFDDAKKEADDKKKKAASAAAPTSGALAVIEEAIVVCANNKGHASAAALRSYVKKEYPQWPKMTYKTAMKRAIAQHRIVLVRGTGLAGTFKKGKNFKKKPDQPAKKGKDAK